MSAPVLIVHGGAGRSIRSAAQRTEKQRALEAALESAYAVLVRSDALQAVTHAVKLLEDDELFNAGTGAQIQADGVSRLSASVMDGQRGVFAGVINIVGIRNPVLVARALLEEKHRVLSDEGALTYALKMGLKKEDTRTPASLSRWQLQAVKGSDTVGACALDGAGRLASAASTGGLGLEIPGRVSDSPMPAGNYANRFCAVCATGIGEDIIDEALASKIVTRVTDGLTLNKAFAKSFGELRAMERKAGAIGLDARGHTAHDTAAGELLFAVKSA